MDQPLVNLNMYPNSIDQTNPETQRNINVQGNQFQNQGQCQTIQQNIDLPPEQPCYLSSSNTNTPNEKPKKSQQNQINTSTLLFPAQSNHQTNCPSPNEGVFKAQSVFNIENQKYNNFSEIPHKGILYCK